MLYTAMPLERIYHQFASMQNPSSPLPAFPDDSTMFHTKKTTVHLPNGTVTVVKNGKECIIESVNSTDMTDYLNKKYCPGATFLENEFRDYFS